jgi:starch phosphorylase
MSEALSTGDPTDGRRDVAQAIATLAERLPEPLGGLARVAHDYSWTWSPRGPEIFRRIDLGLWRRSCCNPRWLIEAVAPHRWRELADDASYLELLADEVARLDAQAARPPLESVAISPAHPVAYLCSEFGVHCSLPLYGGGLGVLAGDLLKAASDLGLPLVGVGILYRQGYFHQRLDIEGWQREYWTTTDFERHPVVRLMRREGEPLWVPVEIRGRVVRVQVWRADVGRVPLYLLDTDCEQNEPVDRWITARLYIGDRHTRLAQYAVLGVGGVRALAALGITPSVYHLNEGHPALAGLERLGELVRTGLSIDDALAEVRRTTVFTTHTPVAAGNEWYSLAEVEPVFGSFADQLGIPRRECYGLGRTNPDDESEPVCITPLALRTSGAANGVSRRHGEVARAMWQSLWPGREVQDVPIGAVTNGVHSTTWMATPMQALLDRYLDPAWRSRVDDETVWQGLAAIPDEEIWQARCELRTRLVAFAREHSVFDRLARGESPEYVEAAARVFDPDALTIGFARRVATYKRLHLLTRQLERGLRLLADTTRPIQVVIAGKAHPSDEDAKRTLSALMAARRAPHVGSRIAFLEDYDLHMAGTVVSGVDLWLNFPRPPLEASGTSGMKVALNGGLNLSVLDGWWEEGYDAEAGWAIASLGGADAEAQDDYDSAVAFDLLEEQVIPLFYECDENGLPLRWIAKIRASMQRLIPRFSAQRMLHDYLTTVYPAGGRP